MKEAADALEEAIVGRINIGEVIPTPSVVKPGQFLIPVPAQTACKAALYDEINDPTRTPILKARFHISWTHMEHQGLYEASELSFMRGDTGTLADLLLSVLTVSKSTSYLGSLTKGVVTAQ